MSWPSNDFEFAIQNELDALHKVVRSCLDMRQKFGDEYQGRFAELDEALDGWAALYTVDELELVELTPEEQAFVRAAAARFAAEHGAEPNCDEKKGSP